MSDQIEDRNTHNPMEGFTSFRDRTLAPGTSVRVCRNLNRPAYYSIKALSGPNKGKVVGHAKAIALRDIIFRVSEKTRQTVIRKQERSVHAFADGTVIGTRDELPKNLCTDDACVVTYQPYLAGHFFYCSHPKTPVEKLEHAWAWGSGLITTPSPN